MRQLKIDVAKDPRAFDVVTGRGTDDEITWRCRMTYATEEHIWNNATEHVTRPDGEPAIRPRHGTIMTIALDEIVVSWEGIVGADGEAIEYDPQIGKDHISTDARMELAIEVWNRIMTGGN